MDISSTPFIRNDYFPDYNDLNEINQRIDEVENEISLVNIRLTNDIENVSNNLNTYINSQADTTITNNIIVNNLNANYAMGDYLNFDNVNFNNAYIENLTVNKPVFDITLNTAHIENTTSLGGNFYNPSLINPSFSELEEINSDNASFNNATIANLFVNVTEEPISSSAVLGYDSDGRVIPIHATYDVSFPEGADYLYTDSMGVARKGTASTEVDTSTSLITSYGVKNAIDSFSENVSANLNVIYDSLNDIDQWENTFENTTADTFNDVFNMMNDMNNSVNDGFNEVNNGFNDVNDYKNTVNDSLNNINNDISDLSNKIGYLQNLSNMEWSYTTAYFTAVYPLDYTSYTNIHLGYPESTDGYTTLNVGKFNLGYPRILYNETEKTVYFCKYFDKDFPPLINRVFKGCANFNEAVTIPNTVIDTSSMFYSCNNLNQPITIPSSVSNASNMFAYCNNFNQPITIPSSVVDASNMFIDCFTFNQAVTISDGVVNIKRMLTDSRFNQPLDIPSSVTDASGVLGQCFFFNQPVTISNGVTNLSYMFEQCENFSQPIDIPNSVTDTSLMFMDCNNFNQTVNISNSVTNTKGMFTRCTSLNRSIDIPSNVVDCASMFSGCSAYNVMIVNIASDKIENMQGMFGGTMLNDVTLVRINSSIPKDTSNFIFNSLVNGSTGVTFIAEHIYNDIE